MRWLAVAFVVACAAAPPTVEPPPPGARGLAMIEASPDLDGAVVGATDARATVAIVFASWCIHCQRELAILGELRGAHPNTRVLGLNYRGHEEYDGRGSAEAVRRFVATRAPWLRVVPIDDAVFAALGRPAKVPTIAIYDRAGRLVIRYDRRARPMPSADELDELLRRLGA